MQLSDFALQIQQLEDHVASLVVSSGIRMPVWLRFAGVLADLKAHNPGMYMHSLRVGIYAHGLAAFEDQTDLKFPLFAGCGHDVGKCTVSNECLNTTQMTAEQFEEIKQHAVQGYDILHDSFLYTSFVAGLHHTFQKNAYGIDLDDVAPTGLRPEQRAYILETAQLVAIADFFDALTTRKNDKGLIKNIRDPQEQRAAMLEHFPESPSKIDWLINNRIQP